MTRITSVNAGQLVTEIDREVKGEYDGAPYGRNEDGLPMLKPSMYEPPSFPEPGPQLVADPEQDWVLKVKTWDPDRERWLDPEDNIYGLTDTDAPQERYVPVKLGAATRCIHPVRGDWGGDR